MISIRDIDFARSTQKLTDKVHVTPSMFGLSDVESFNNPVSIAVLDTGCPSHSGIQVRGTYAKNNYADFIGNDMIPWDKNGHATAISGVIAGKTDRFSGMCPSALMCYVKCIDNDGKTNIKKISAGMLWGAARQVDIILVAAGSDEHDRYMEEVVAKCVQRGIVIVAAGKSNSVKNAKIAFPGALPGVISCSFDKSTSLRVKESGGIDVRLGHGSVWTMAPEDKYIKLGGSSMAAAITAGFIASHIASGKSKDDVLKMMKEISSCH